MSALLISIVIFLIVFTFLIIVLIFSKDKSRTSYILAISASLVLSGAIYYTKDLSHKHYDSVTEERYKKNLFFWKMEQEKSTNLSLKYGILKKDNILKKPTNIVYVSVPSLKELNENQQLKEEFDSYKREFNHKRILLMNYLMLENYLH